MSNNDNSQPRQITFSEFVVAANSNIPAEVRVGQHASNMLFMARPDLSRRVVEAADNGENVDPFYSDENLPRFYVWVAEHWDV